MTMARRTIIAILAAALGVTFAAPAAAQFDPPSPYTISRNRETAAVSPFADMRDFEFASRGYLGTRADPIIRGADGRVVWDLTWFDFLKGDAPGSANPSLWRQSQLTARHGLFKVTDEIHQVRGFDTANITFVRGNTGWVVIDALTTIETSRAAYDLVTERLGRRPISALIFTHSHADHFGGAEGLKPAFARDAEVLAPVGFFAAAISESVIAGPAMARRATYQFGVPLEKSVNANVGVGIGAAIPQGTRGIVAPTREIDRNGSEMVIDGVRLKFQLTLNTEAPAEMNIGFPDLGVLDLAENANQTQHNILTPRGAQIRSAKAWADGLTHALDMFSGSQILITSHGWPRFGAEEVETYINNHRDSYAYLHDQSVRLMNKGYTGEEIAARLKLPGALEREWYNRPYYGSLTFNARAVYQYYMGWYDANPVRLAPLPPEEGGRRYVEAMGGALRVRELAQVAYDKGEYPWAAELLNRVVFADANDAAARALLAKCYQQLAWQSESSLARNMYLTGALELQNGPSVASRPGDGGFLDILPVTAVFDMLATRVDPDKVGETRLRIGFVFAKDQVNLVAQIGNGVLTHRPLRGGEKLDATVIIERPDFLDVVMRNGALAPKLASGAVKITGDSGILSRFVGLFDQPDPRFAIVTP
jgi:alkyl sulfatase BDS1-like metallo-beta-lactamase superfamily hydrolase